MTWNGAPCNGAGGSGSGDGWVGEGPSHPSVSQAIVINVTVVGGGVGIVVTGESQPDVERGNER